MAFLETRFPFRFGEKTRTRTKKLETQKNLKTAGEQFNNGKGKIIQTRKDHKLSGELNNKKYYFFHRKTVFIVITLHIRISYL